jgi:hypothetical protein
LTFEKEVERDHAFDRLLPRMRFGKLGDKVARFRQVNMDRPNVHHDALEFPDGQIVLVTKAYAKASMQPYCNCQRPRASPTQRRSRCAVLPSRDSRRCARRSIALAFRGALLKASG